MRDIEFRGYNKELGWVYGMYVDGYIVSGVIEANEEYVSIEDWCPVDKNTVGQYTGFTDVRGKKIYEGDICRVTGNEPYSNDYFTTLYDWEKLMSVDFIYGAFELRGCKDKHESFYFIETQDMEIRIVGNVYDWEAK